MIQHVVTLNGTIPLHLACSYGHLEIARYLSMPVTVTHHALALMVLHHFTWLVHMVILKLPDT